MRIRSILALAFISFQLIGCGSGQDPEQPAAGSIDVAGDKDKDLPSKANKAGK